MQITAVFDSHEEMKDFASKVLGITGEISKPVKTEKEKPAKAAPEETSIKPQPQPDPVAETATKEDEVKGYTLEEVRGKLAALRKAGKNIQLVLESFGVKKLTEIPAEQYADVMKKAEEL